MSAIATPCPYGIAEHAYGSDPRCNGCGLDALPGTRATAFLASITAQDEYGSHPGYLAPGAILAAVADAEAPRYGRRADGYGRRVPTRYRVRIADIHGVPRWHRVRVAILGNAGYPYVTVRGIDLGVEIYGAEERIHALAEAVSE